MMLYRVLGEYYPAGPVADWKAWRIGRALTQMTYNLGLMPLKDPIHGPLDVSWSNNELHAEVRRTTSYGKGGDEWHQDGDTTPGARMNYAMVLWSNVTPTLFKLPNGTIYQPKPFEVVVALNQRVYHRRPDSAPAKRFLFRQRVEIPKHLFH